MRLDDLIADITTLANDATGRVMIGLVGEPGVGKSTVADAVIEHLGSASVLLPMDGFHLSNEVLIAADSRDRKGAPDTFDAAGFATTLRRVRSDDGVVYAPRFHREIEESIAAEIVIEPRHRVVIAEGNYLLHDGDGWSEIGDLFDRVWYLRLPDDVRLRRLIARHERYGKSPTEAQAWATGSDEANAEIIRATAPRATAIVDLDP